MNNNSTSPKYTLNTADLLKTLENAAIFFFPLAIANQSYISALLASFGTDPRLTAVAFSLLAYLARRFASGTASVVPDSVIL